MKAHKNLKRTLKNILTIIIPRHINRSKEIKVLCEKLNLKSQILEKNDVIKKDNEILIINAFGMLPKYFKYSKSVFIGKSIIKSLSSISGQSPIEAVKLGCKVYHGPFVYNFKEIYQLLNSWGATEEIKDYEQLAQKLLKDFKNSKNKKVLVRKKMFKLGNRILKDNVNEIRSLVK